MCVCDFSISVIAVLIFSDFTVFFFCAASCDSWKRATYLAGHEQQQQSAHAPTTR